MSEEQNNTITYTEGVVCPHCQTPISNQELGRLWGKRVKPLFATRSNRFAKMTKEELHAESIKANKARWEKHRAAKTAQAMQAQAEMRDAVEPTMPRTVVEALDELDTIFGKADKEDQDG